MKFLKPAALIACMLVVFSCNSGPSENIKWKEISLAKVEEDKNPATGQNDQVADTTQVPSQKQQVQSGNHVIQQSKIDWDKKIIKNASINLEVKNYQSFNDLLHGNIKRFGGYVAQEEQNQTDYKIENSITIKVPVDQFDDLVAALITGEQKLIEKKITSEDVTTQVVDTRSRMEAK